jgi:hypothetical protein
MTHLDWLKNQERTLGNEYKVLDSAIASSEGASKRLSLQQQEVAEMLVSISEEIDAMEAKARLVNELMTTADELRAAADRLDAQARELSKKRETDSTTIQSDEMDVADIPGVFEINDIDPREADPEDYSEPVTIGDLLAAQHEIYAVLEAAGIIDAHETGTPVPDLNKRYAQASEMDTIQEDQIHFEPVFVLRVGHFVSRRR